MQTDPMMSCGWTKDTRLAASTTSPATRLNVRPEIVKLYSKTSIICPGPSRFPGCISRRPDLLLSYDIVARFEDVSTLNCAPLHEHVGSLVINLDIISKCLAEVSFAMSEWERSKNIGDPPSASARSVSAYHFFVLSRGHGLVLWVLKITRDLLSQHLNLYLITNISDIV
jgi:hypothetical protein